MISLLLELVERGEDFLAVMGGIYCGVGFGNFAGGVDEEGVTGGELYHSEVRQRTVGLAHLAVAVGQQFEV